MRTRPFAARTGADRWGIVTTAALLLLPVVLGALLAWSLSAPQEHLDRLTVAVVNDDVPVSLDGQTVPVGRQLAAGLMAGDGVDWVLTNDDEASAGVAAGRYVAVLTIPASFSAQATSATGPAADAQQARLQVRTSPSAALLDPALVQSVTDQAVAALNGQLLTQYLTQLYQGFTTIDEQIGQASQGAQTLASGAASLDQGAQQLLTGANQLTAGLDDLDAGASSLSDGLDQLDSSVQALPQQTAQLARGSAAVAGAIDPVAAQLAAAAADLTATVASVCQTPGRACDLATSALARVQAADQRVGTLSTAADGVAAGNRSLASAMPRVVDGIGEAASGAADLADGVGQAGSGAADLDAGSADVADGAAQVDTGAAQLADGLVQAVTQIPTYSDADITVLSSVASQPVGADLALPVPGIPAAPFLAVVALWFAALVVILARAAVPTSPLLTATASGTIARRAGLPVAATGAAQGVLTALAVLAVVGADPSTWLGAAAAGGLVGLTFVVVNQGLAAALGGFGRAVAALVGVVALAVGTTSTVPDAVRSAAVLLPTAPGLDLLRGALTTDAAGARGDVVALLAFAALGVVLVLVGTTAQRRRRARELVAQSPRPGPLEVYGQSAPSRTSSKQIEGALMSDDQSTDVVAALSDGAYTLFVADFTDTETAWAAYEALKEVEDGSRLDIDGVIVVKRELDGTLEIQKATDHSTRRGLTWGVVGGVALGLIFPPSILGSAAVLGAVGAATGKARELSHRKGLAEELQDAIVPGHSGLVALVSDPTAVKLREALDKADAIVEKAIDKAEADEIKAAAKELEAEAEAGAK